MPEAFEKMLQDPKATVHMNEVFTIVKADGSLCKAVFIDDLTASIS
jgi:hypothetical protein